MNNSMSTRDKMKCMDFIKNLTYQNQYKRVRKSGLYLFKKLNLLSKPSYKKNSGPDDFISKIYKILKK